MTRKRLILVAIIAVAIIGLAVSLARKPNSVSPEPTATPSSTPALSSEDQAQLEDYSRQFAIKYFNYTRPDDPTYLQSFKPFVTPDLYTRLVASNEKARQFPTIPALSGEVASVSVSADAADNAQVTLIVRLTTSGNQREEEVTLTWHKIEKRWAITELETSSTSPSPASS
jgi:hypothetical protein